MANVLLINPPWKIYNDRNLWTKVASTYPNLGLGYIASILEQNGHTVKILDLNLESSSFNEVYDFVGLTATTPLINNALKIAKDIKVVCPNIKVILGGIHPTVKTEEVLRNPQVDYVVCGEGEITFKELINGNRIEEILGLSWKDKKGQIWHNPDRPLIKNLDDIPLPAYHLMPIKKYKPAIGSYKRLPAMSIFATRGCKGRCTFCFNPYKYCRPRSAQKIIEEIKLLQKDYGIREIQFYDDSFTLFKNVIKDFCEILIKDKIDISWSCFSRVDNVNKEMLKLMHKAGCHLILFGVESSNEQILKNINKNIKLSDVKKCVNWCKKIGIETRASFMFGNVGETIQTMKDTIQFAIDLDPDTVQFNIATPFPGTEFHKWAMENNYMKDLSYSEYTVSEVLFNHPTVSEENLKKYYNLAHKKFYLRPKVILRRLLRIKSWQQLKQEIQGALAVIE